MKEQQLFLGRPADRSELLTAAAQQHHHPPGHAAAQETPRPTGQQDTPRGVAAWLLYPPAPGVCSEVASAARRRQFPGAKESSTINRVFPVHARRHYAALTLLSSPCTKSREEANPRGAVLMPFSFTALERRVGSAGNRRAKQAARSSPPQAAILFPYSLQSSGTLQWATAQLLCSSSTVPVTAEPCSQPTARPALSKHHCPRLHTQNGGSHGNHGHWTAQAQLQRPLFYTGTWPVFQGAAVGSCIRRNWAPVTNSLAKYSDIPTDRMAHKRDCPCTRKLLKGNIKTLHLYFTWEDGKLSKRN